jgi:hypothetical protein
MKDKAFLTEAEVAAIEKRTATIARRTTSPAARIRQPTNRFWYDDGTKVLATRPDVTRRRSA